MPFMPFTLADLLSVPTFSPILDSDVPHDAESILGFTLVTKSIIHQILSGVAYLHSPERRIAHRDIKPRNILLDTLGVAVLIDFGVAYSPTAAPRDVWPEPEGKMYFEVGSGYVQRFPISNAPRRGPVVVLFRPYRAPELLFGVRKYDATACDLWALGTTIAEFFTTLHRRPLSSDFDDDSDTEERGDPTKAYLSDELPEPWSRTEWERYSLFDGSRGDIGLAWSIFRTRGSPTQETWPVRFLPSIYPAARHISCIIRHSRIYPTQTRSILSTRLACTYQRCCLTSVHRFHMGTKYIPPGNNNPMWLIYYNACSITRPTRVSRLQMRSCIRGY
jgi:serine/threonine protein kinase